MDQRRNHKGNANWIRQMKIRQPIKICVIYRALSTYKEEKSHYNYLSYHLKKL